LIREVENAREWLTQSLKRSPTPAEIAEYMGESIETVLETLEMQGALRPVSLDAANSSDDEEGANLYAMLGYEESGYENFESSDMVRRVMQQMPEMERTILIERFVNNRSQREVASMLDVSQMTISRGEKRAIARFRELLPKEEE